MIDSNEIDCIYYYSYDTGRNETYNQVYENLYKFYSHNKFLKILIVR
jgi:hypothetical protein